LLSDGYGDPIETCQRDASGQKRFSSAGAYGTLWGKVFSDKRLKISSAKSVHTTVPKALIENLRDNLGCITICFFAVTSTHVGYSKIRGLISSHTRYDALKSVLRKNAVVAVENAEGFDQYFVVCVKELQVNTDSMSVLKGFQQQAKGRGKSRYFAKVFVETISKSM